MSNGVINNQSNDCDLSDQKKSRRNVQTGYSLALHSATTAAIYNVSKDIKELKPGEKLFGSLDSNCVIIILTIIGIALAFAWVYRQGSYYAQKKIKPRVGSKFFTNERLNQLAEYIPPISFFAIYTIILFNYCNPSPCFKEGFIILLILLIAAFIILLIAALICGSKCKLKTP